MNFSAVILAGGKSQRMGHEKALLVVGGKPLILRQIELVRELGAAEIFISGRAETDYRAPHCRVLTDRFENAGPLAGVERALGAISTPLLLVLAIDMPRMDLTPLQLLLADCTDNCGAIPRFQSGLEPLAAVYPHNALSLVKELLEGQSLSARYFAKRCVKLNLASFVDLPEKHLQNFENWNTPMDVSEAIG